jgi:hypothetical protein
VRGKHTGFFLAGQSHYKAAKHQELLFYYIYYYISISLRMIGAGEVVRLPIVMISDREQVPFYKFYLQ